MENPLKTFYVKLWVPIFGRFVSIFIPLIEGQKPKEKPSYKLPDYSKSEDEV